MPTLALFDSEAAPDAWHRVTAPGGYECWKVEAIDRVADIRIIAELHQGFFLHPAYLRRYAAYLRKPTRRAPPLPAEYPCARLAVYQQGRLAGQFIVQVRAEEFVALADGTEVRAGPNRLTRHADMKLTFALKEGAVGAELILRPRFPHEPIERPLLSTQLPSTHAWVLSDPLCDVTGEIRLGDRTSKLRGLGHYEHYYGTGPLAPGMRWWMSGWAPNDLSAIAFQISMPRDHGLPREVCIIEASATGQRDLEAEMVRVEEIRYAPLGLAYPAIVRLPGMTFGRPRIVGRSAVELYLNYERSDGSGADLQCTIVYPNRARWPVLGRIIQRSINKTSLGFR